MRSRRVLLVLSLIILLVSPTLFVHAQGGDTKATKPLSAGSR